MMAVSPDHTVKWMNLQQISILIRMNLQEMSGHLEKVDDDHETFRVCIYTVAPVSQPVQVTLARR